MRRFAAPISLSLLAAFTTLTSFTAITSLTLSGCSSNAPGKSSNFPSSTSSTSDASTSGASSSTDSGFGASGSAPIATIYSGATKFLTAKDIQALDKTAKITPDTDDADWSELTAKLSDGSEIKLNHESSNAKALDANIEDLRRTITATIKDQMTTVAFDLILITNKTKHTVTLTSTEPFSAAGNAFISSIAQKENAIVLHDNIVSDYTGKNLLADKASNQDLPYFPSARKRKEASDAILKSKGIPVANFLAPIEGEEEIVTRTPQETAQRLLALWVVALKADGAKQPLLDKLLKGGNVQAYLTPKEAKFVATKAPTKDDTAAYSWYIENIQTLLYALGQEKELPLSKEQCNSGEVAEKVVKLIGSDNGKTFVKQAKLRSNSEILNAKDLTLRAHWATEEATSNKQPQPKNTNHEVLLERHKTLNWLTKYNDEDWDDVTADT